MNSGVKYHLNDDGRFVIENYNNAKLFSNFLPGIAGIFGIPMWVFYVNRGQCVASFGIESKDKAIMEFQPANKSYRQTTLQGFRTFLKISSEHSSAYWEPFQQYLLGTDFEKSQTLSMAAHDFSIHEVNHSLGLALDVQYFTVPEEPYSGLVRRVTITNRSARPYDIDMIDGLPMIVPFGLKDWLNKNLSRTIEAWAKVRNLENKAPFYQLNVEVSDTPVVTHIKEGNFFFGFDGATKNLFEPIAEAQKIFGAANDFTAPAAFLEGKLNLDHKQQTSNRTPCAMGHARFKLKPGETREFYFLFGYAADVDRLNALVDEVRADGFMDVKRQRNADIIDEVKQFALTNSSSRAFNLYAEQTFLDNVMRGGLPISVKTGPGNVAFNVFSRKHGDLERDYNYFFVAPTYYSQGNGNYRDVNQNRRNDVWFNVDVRDGHLTNFMNLIQADGYNPLIVKGATFIVEDLHKIDAALNDSIGLKGRPAVKAFLQKSFLPGELLKFIETHEIGMTTDAKEFLGKVLEICSKHESADHGEGFWIDHWTYNLDLIESYLSMYPEDLRRLLVEKNDFFFYHNSHYVLPREQRHVLTDRGVRQYEAVHNGRKEIQAEEKGNQLRTNNGEGAVYQTTLLCKMICLIANKIATLDPSGLGVEMEADKPSWYDALNGLPGLLGSSMCETIEIKRYAQFLRGALDRIAAPPTMTITVFEELAGFLDGLTAVLSTEKTPLGYWQKSNGLKEEYRLHIRKGITGNEKKISIKAIKKFLDLTIERTETAVARICKDDGFLPTYFYHEVISYDELGKTPHGNHSFVKAKGFRRHSLPLYLEGYVHALRAEPDPQRARDLYHQVRESALFDQKLKMYKVNTDLNGESEEIGRARVFPSGWLENESIWLHMEYKLLLELLRRGMVSEFYENFENVLVPFLKPEQYGRSILENSSFLVSSAHEDEQLHGRGFVARLSGSTADFLHIWLMMNAGPQPFTLDEKNNLTLQFKPMLQGSLFTKEKTTVEYGDIHAVRHSVTLPENTYAFNFLGAVLVTYHNPARKNTYGPNRADIKEIRLTYASKQKAEVIPSSVIPSPFAEDIRNRKVSRIDVMMQ